MGQRLGHPSISSSPPGLALVGWRDPFAQLLAPLPGCHVVVTDAGQAIDLVEFDLVVILAIDLVEFNLVEFDLVEFDLVEFDLSTVHSGDHGHLIGHHLGLDHRMLDLGFLGMK